MDIKEKNLRKLSYGLYLIGAMDGERPCGCIVNTVFQVTSENPIIATSINKNNYTWELVQKNGRFSVSKSSLFLLHGKNPNSFTVGPKRAITLAFSEAEAI